MIDRTVVKSSLMICLVVLASLITPVSGVAAQVPAASPGPEAGECSNLDDFVMFLTLGAVNADSCSRQAYVNDAVEDMKQSDANQSKVDIYSAAAGVKGGVETWGSPYDNYLQDTESVAWMKAESAIAQAYQSGKSKPEAKVAAREAIADYYAVKQQNLIEQWDFSTSQMWTLREQARMEDGISENYVGFAYRNVQQDDGMVASRSFEDVTVQTQLVNSSTVNTSAIQITASESGNHETDTITVSSGPQRAGLYVNQNVGEWFATYYSWRVQPANDNYETLHVMNFTKFADRWQQTEDMNSALQSEASAFVDATWDDYDSGQINASDVISSNTAMFEYGVRSGNESESLYRSTAALSLMGYDTPNLNNSGVMTVEYKNVERTGLLMARNAPNGTWEVNTTYNTSDIEGPVFLTTTTGEKIDFAEGEEFTITSLTAKDGTAINSTQTTRYRYKTANTAELLEVQNQLLELRQEIEDRERSVGGAGALLGDFGDVPLLAVAAALAAIALLLNRNQ
ncbi:hypothetical protein [Halorubrum halophilum]|uniref:hypothetical protein n=1 Tax=Halorubrum halophilum TaxID=413816 RepID=UPI00186AEE2B|nr:hypothetical protein [Halorubrum halophilum]